MFKKIDVLLKQWSILLRKCYYYIQFKELSAISSLIYNLGTPSNAELTSC